MFDINNDNTKINRFSFNWMKKGGCLFSRNAFDALNKTKSMDCVKIWKICASFQLNSGPNLKKRGFFFVIYRFENLLLYYFASKKKKRGIFVENIRSIENDWNFRHDEKLFVNNWCIICLLCNWLWKISVEYKLQILLH